MSTLRYRDRFNIAESLGLKPAGPVDQLAEAICREAPIAYPALHNILTALERKGWTFRAPPE